MRQQAQSDQADPVELRLLFDSLRRFLAQGFGLQVAEDKWRLFPNRKYRYPEARSGTRRLIPQGSALKNLEQDYRGMIDPGFFHEPPSPLAEILNLDLRMPHLAGVAVVEQIRQQEPGARLIILITYDEEEAVYQSIGAGARGYLLKDFSRKDLLNCIRRVAAGGMCLPVALAAERSYFVDERAPSNRRNFFGNPGGAGFARLNNFPPPFLPKKPRKPARTPGLT